MRVDTLSFTPPYARYVIFIVFAALVWFGRFGIWAWRNAPIYLSARLDGMAGQAESETPTLVRFLSHFLPVNRTNA